MLEKPEEPRYWFSFVNMREIAFTIVNYDQRAP